MAKSRELKRALKVLVFALAIALFLLINSKQFMTAAFVALVMGALTYMVYSRGRLL